MANATSDVFASVVTPSKCDSLKDETRQVSKPGKGSPILQLTSGLRMQTDVDADMDKTWKSLPSLAVKLPLWRLSAEEAVGMWASTHTED